MKYHIHEHGKYMLLSLQGDVDLSCSPVAREQILKLLKNNKNVLVDLSEVDYIDSSGVASLVEGFQTAKNKKLEFSLVGVSKAAMQVLQLARLDKVFNIYQSLEDC